MIYVLLCDLSQEHFTHDELKEWSIIIVLFFFFLSVYINFSFHSLVVFAGDVTPIEIMCHLPAVCEDKDIPYCYTPSRQEIGTAMGVKRGSLMVLIKEHPEYKDLYDEVKNEMVKLALPLWILFYQKFFLLFVTFDEIHWTVCKYISYFFPNDQTKQM